MQPQTNNPFPLSDKEPTSSTPQHVDPVPSAVITPTISPAPAPTSNSLFVLPSQATTQSIDPSGPLAAIENLLLRTFSYPSIQLPDFLKDMFARYLPWMTLMSVFILAPILFIGIAMGGFLGIITSFYSLNTNPFYWLTLVLITGQVILLLVSIRPLLREQRFGWVMLFASVFVSVASAITNLFAQFINPVIVLAVTALLGISTLYILFQTRNYFTK